MTQPLDPPADLSDLLPAARANDGSLVLANGERLTPRDVSVLEQLRSGESYRVVARRLSISESTVAHSVSRMSAQTGLVRTRLAILSEFLSEDAGT